MSDRYLSFVVGVAVVGDHVHRLPFSDGTARDFDFSGEHWNGVLEPLNDPSYFAEVAVELGADTSGCRTALTSHPRPSTSKPRPIQSLLLSPTASRHSSSCKDECASDVVVCLALLAEILGVDLASAVGSKIEQLEVRNRQAGITDSQGP